MDPKEQEKKLDQWLDEALSQYSDAEPRAGLEQRVLANVRSQENAPKRRWWMTWTPAMAAVAAAAIVMVAVKPALRVTPPVRQAESNTSTKVQSKVTEASKPQVATPEARDKVATRSVPTKPESRRAVDTASATKTPAMNAPTAPPQITAAVSAQQMQIASEPPAVPANTDAAPRFANGRAAPMRERKLPGETLELATIPLEAPSDAATAGRAMGAAVIVGRAVPSQSSANEGGMYRAVVAEPSAKQSAVFPTARPLSVEERLMISAAAQGGLQDVDEQMPQRDELPTVVIQEIRIKPLQDPGK